MAYEAMRMFRDRLVGKDDRAAFDAILSTVLRGDWGREPPAPNDFVTPHVIL